MQTIQLGRRHRNKQRLIAGGGAAVLGALLGAGAVAAVFFAMATAARPGGSGAPADAGIVQLERVVIVGQRADRQQQAAAIEQLPRVLVTGRSSATAAAPAELRLAADGFKPRAL